MGVGGQGYGIRLWRAAVAHLAGRNTGLDGVVDQRENYRRSGFRRIKPVFECARMYTGDRPDVDFGGVCAATTLELG